MTKTSEESTIREFFVDHDEDSLELKRGKFQFICVFKLCELVRILCQNSLNTPGTQNFVTKL